MLTHDVDTAKGRDRCGELMEMEKDLGFRSSFNFVPERYELPADLRRGLKENGFEVGVHGLNHDGRLYRSYKLFKKRAKRINVYLDEWGAAGFRSPAMHHNLDWIHDLNITYDASTFDTDPFEPQPEGIGTIFPFIVRGGNGRRGYVELPYTLPQDFTLFVLMKEKNIDLWKEKLDWVAEKGGMALVNVHPDYIAFGAAKPSHSEYPARYYRDLLEYLKERYDGDFWHRLPRDVADLWLRKP